LGWDGAGRDGADIHSIALVSNTQRGSNWAGVKPAMATGSGTGRLTVPPASSLAAAAATLVPAARPGGKAGGHAHLGMGADGDAWVSCHGLPQAAAVGLKHWARVCVRWPGVAGERGSKKQLWQRRQRR
jgi:hypothetical protein